MARSTKKGGSEKVAPTPPSWGMVSRPNWLHKLLFRLFFDPRDLEPDCVEKVRRAAKKGVPVYVAGYRHFFDFLFFNWAFFCHELPLARFVNAIVIWFVQPVRALVALLRGRYTKPESERIEEVTRKGESSFVFLRSPVELRSGKGELGVGLLDKLIELQAELDRPIVFVPLVLIWGQHPVRPGLEQSRLGRIFGKAESPGRLRSLAQFVVYLRRVRARVAEPVDLVEFLAAHEGVERDRQAEELRWKLMGAAERQRYAVLGPPRKGARRIRAEILQSSEVRSRMAKLAEEQGSSEQSLHREADRYLREISADIGPITLRFMRSLMGFAFSRIYTQIDVPKDMFEKLRAAGAKGPLLLLPSHKSHVDYLFVSWIVAANGVAPPLIAAGINLSFWPAGPIFRRSGAFFLRRSFRGNRLYTLMFTEYLAKVLREGYNMEFFIEGGRSRSGKVLPPKMGLLKWIADAVIEGKATNVQVVPMNITYEKVIEVGSYARELAGASKKAEGATDLVRAGRVLGGRFGRVTLHLGDPFFLKDALMDAGAREEGDEESLAAAVNRVAHRVVYYISRLVTVTPTSLLASGLLCFGRRSLPRSSVLAACGLFAQRARAYGGRFSKALASDTEERGGGRGPAGCMESVDSLLSVEALDAAVDGFVRDRVLTVHRETDEVYYHVSDDGRSILSYYRNSLINHLVQESLVARAFLSLAKRGRVAEEDSLDGVEVALDELKRSSLELSRLFKKEFIYESRTPFDVIFRDTVEAMLGWGLDLVENGAGEIEPRRKGAGGETGSGVFGSGVSGPTVSGPTVSEPTVSEPVVEARAVRPARPEGPRCLELLSGLCDDFFQAYRSGAAGLKVLLDGPMGKKALERRMHERALREYYMGMVTRKEACNRLLFRNAIELWLDEGVLREAPGQTRSGPPVALADSWANEEALARLTTSVGRFEA